MILVYHTIPIIFLNSPKTTPTSQKRPCDNVSRVENNFAELFWNEIGETKVTKLTHFNATEAGAVILGHLGYMRHGTPCTCQ